MKRIFLQLNRENGKEKVIIGERNKQDKVIKIFGKVVETGELIDVDYWNKTIEKLRNNGLFAPSDKKI